MPVVTLIRELAEAMEADGHPKPFGVKTRPDGQKVVDVWPLGWAQSCPASAVALPALLLPASRTAPPTLAIQA